MNFGSLPSEHLVKTFITTARVLRSTQEERAMLYLHCKCGHPTPSDTGLGHLASYFSSETSILILFPSWFSVDLFPSESYGLYTIVCVFLRFTYSYFMHTYVLPLPCLFTNVHAWCPGKPETGIGYPGTAMKTVVKPMSSVRAASALNG